MNSSQFTKNSIDTAIRLILLLILAYCCFLLIEPFIIPLIWGVVIAVAIFPAFAKLKAALGNRNKSAAALYTLVALAILMTPTILVSNSIVDTTKVLSERYTAGSLEIPAPPESVREWPVIGEDVYEIWAESSTNLETALVRYRPQLKEFAQALVSAVTGIGGDILMFLLSIIISGVLLANATAANRVTTQIFSRLVSVDQGQEYVDLSSKTIRGVAQGVIGVAAIQSVLSAAGMLVMGVPAWGLWSVLVLVMAIAQLPVILVLGGVVAYVFSVADTIPAVIFALYCLVVSLSDGFLKPLLMGRGLNTPMLVILLGAIGGMLAAGIIGLFVGAVVLAIGYELFMKWLNDGGEEAGDSSPDSTQP